MPIAGGASVSLPSEANLAGVMGGLATIASSSVTGMFPANLFPGINASRFGFAPNDNSFCLFHVPKAGGKTPTIPSAAYVAPGAYGYSSGSGTAFTCPLLGHPYPGMLRCVPSCPSSCEQL